MLIGIFAANLYLIGDIGVITKKQTDQTIRLPPDSLNTICNLCLSEFHYKMKHTFLH